ncbi:MAG: 23S rRNA (uracil(1939)-C(5))-methyltransferase RlmD [Eubacteriales bacterium]|nr:23S rRNA (uracil(1939)-C(5))-methyltransferase RlmD [Eubacteriales bacterium]
MGDTSYCKVAKKCSGCQLSNMDYSRQLRYKQNEMRLRFNRLCSLKKIVPSPDTLHYRNKAQFVYKREKNGRVYCGIYQSATGAVIKCGDCALHTDVQNQIGNDIAKLLETHRIPPYDSWRQKGTVKSVIVRQSRKNGDVMVVIVWNTKSKFPKEREFSDALTESHPEIKSVILTESSGDKLMSGANPKVIFGSDSITDSLCGCDFKVSYNSFFQINPGQTENLYRTAISYANLTKNDTVLDAYCGTGTIGIIASKSAGKVYSVEQVENAIKDAKHNARINGRDNIEFVCADSEKHMEELEKKGIRLTAAFLDPPRAGCSKSFLVSLARVSPERIVYISCNIDTQIRDIRLLSKLGYKAEKVQGFDMFPYTRHIESVVLLTRLA